MSGKRRKLIKLWSKIFPSTFFDLGTKPKPLKIGIHDDLKAQFPDLDFKDISLALFNYTRSLRYLKALEEGVPRIDLNGEPCGEVTANAAERARVYSLKRFPFLINKIAA